ncbi:MAG: glycosyltransferase family 4 protein [Verrucomicrobiae bacterium]|nr:glycosyltransferase family 4 protein [Verrucomicrobiae bacterium]
MKVLIVGAGYFPANASLIRAAALGGALKRLGQDPVLCLAESPGSRQLLEQHDLVECCRWVPSRNPAHFARAARDFRDVQFVHLINANLVGEVMGWSLRRHGARVISDWDEWLSSMPRGWKAKLKSVLMEWIARRISSGFVFSSTYLQSEYRRHLGALPTAYIPYGFDPTGPTSPGLAEQCLRPGRQYAMYLGSLGALYREDLQELVLLAACCRDLDLDLLIAGNGSERERLEAEIARFLPDGRAVFTGQLTLPVLDGLVPAPAIRFCFLPLKDTVQNRSRCPNKVFHYIRGGKPVVTNRVGEPANLLAEQGRYYEYGNRASLIAAMRDALARPAQYVLEDYTWKRRAETYLRFLQDHFHPGRSPTPLPPPFPRT